MLSSRLLQRSKETKKDAASMVVETGTLVSGKLNAIPQGTMALHGSHRRAPHLAGVGSQVQA